MASGHPHAGKVRPASSTSVKCRASIYKLVLGLPSDHSKSLFKIPVSDFKGLVGRSVGEIRHDELYIIGTDVNVRWEPEKSVSRITGTFGEPQ